MLQRALITIGAVLTATVFVAPPAGAAPPTRAALSMTCDRGTTHAIAVVTLYDGPARSQATEPTTLECGTDVDSSRTGRIVVSTDFAVGDASIAGYEVTAGAETVMCGGDGTLPIKLACTGSSGSGATVTVR